MYKTPPTANFDACPAAPSTRACRFNVASAEELPAKLTQYAGHLPASPEKRVSGRKTFQRDWKRFLCFSPPTGGTILLLQGRTRSTGGFRDVALGIHQSVACRDTVRFLQENPQGKSNSYKELLIGYQLFGNRKCSTFSRKRPFPSCFRAGRREAPFEY